MYRLIDLKNGSAVRDDKHQIRDFVSKEQAKNVRAQLPGGRDRYAVSRSEKHPKGPSFPTAQVQSYSEGAVVRKPKKRRRSKRRVTRRMT